MYDYNMAHEITNPEYCVIMDEVDGNVHQTGDGDVGTEVYLREKGRIPQEKISKNNTHFMLLGLTLLSGQPLMYVMVAVGKHHNAMVELGVDPFAEDIRDDNDTDNSMNNKEPGKQFSRDPTYYIGNKAVPYICAQNKLGSMTTEIFSTIVQTLDHLKIFDRLTGTNPFLVLVSHDSRLGFFFLRYINDLGHLWVIYIVVSCSTSL